MMVVQTRSYLTSSLEVWKWLQYFLHIKVITFCGYMSAQRTPGYSFWRWLKTVVHLVDSDWVLYIVGIQLLIDSNYIQTNPNSL